MGQPVRDDCAEFRRLVSLPPMERTAQENVAANRHLGSCPECLAWIEELYREVRRAREGGGP